MAARHRMQKCVGRELTDHGKKIRARWFAYIETNDNVDRDAAELNSVYGAILSDMTPQEEEEYVLFVREEFGEAFAVLYRTFA